MNTPALNDNEIQQVLRILRTNGQSPKVVAGVAEQYHIGESVVRGLGKIITEGAGSALTESTGPSPTADAQEMRQQRLAEQLARQVNAAESRPSLAEASTQEIEALAAAYYNG